MKDNIEKLLVLGYKPEAAFDLDAKGVTAKEVEEQDRQDYLSFFTHTTSRTAK